MRCIFFIYFLSYKSIIFSHSERSIRNELIGVELYTILEELVEEQVSREVNLWKLYREEGVNFQVPYETSKRLEQNRKVLNSLNQTLNEYSARTCLHFVKRIPGVHQDYIDFRLGRKCVTRRGRKGGRQIMYLPISDEVTSQKVLLGDECLISSISTGKMLLRTMGVEAIYSNGMRDRKNFHETAKMALKQKDKRTPNRNYKLPNAFMESVNKSYGCTSALKTINRKLRYNCGKPIITPQLSFHHKIVGGSQTRPGSFPWQASLRFKQSDHPICGGSLINHWWILTAAHCFMYSSHPAFYSGYLGKHHKQRHDTSEVKVLFTILIVHKGYTLAAKQHDIGLLKMDQLVSFTDYIIPVCLPTSEFNVPLEGEKMIVTGWGETMGTGENNVLRRVVVPLVGMKECKAAYSLVQDGMICAGESNGGKDACKGDSGGPMVYQTNQGLFNLIGIVSWGEKCGVAGRPGVYTNVAYYLKWIYRNIDSIQETRIKKFL